ncbi:hypothetical protein EYC80_008981 [Monilinia laxa]|uniref:Uncharacterized protein n=1 Tax=Monilinia laxa TaxID=61186 RepID=A0A5N6K212_MONLA|nr:hypothetical protein EYC80_008981 [Monilinia laxa]
MSNQNLISSPDSILASPFIHSSLPTRQYRHLPSPSKSLSLGQTKRISPLAPLSAQPSRSLIQPSKQQSVGLAPIFEPSALSKQYWIICNRSLQSISHIPSTQSNPIQTPRYAYKQKYIAPPLTPPIQLA